MLLLQVHGRRHILTVITTQICKDSDNHINVEKWQELHMYVPKYKSTGTLARQHHYQRLIYAKH